MSHYAGTRGAAEWAGDALPHPTAARQPLKVPPAQRAYATLTPPGRNGRARAWITQEPRYHLRLAKPAPHSADRCIGAQVEESAKRPPLT